MFSANASCSEKFDPKLLGLAMVVLKAKETFTLALRVRPGIRFLGCATIPVVKEDRTFAVM